MKYACSIILTLLVTGQTMNSYARDAGFNLIVAPSRYSVMQVMFDVIDHRSAVLVSYQGEAATANPLIHVWDGTAWNQLAMHDLRELSFVKKTPTRAILIGGDDLLPTSIRDALAWMPELVFIRQLDNAALINELGRVLKWSRSEWSWFSKRYNLTLEDEAAPLRKSSWYDQTGPLRGGTSSTYEPVPVTTTREPLNPSSTMLPPLAPVERPSDIPAASKGSAADQGDDLDDLVESLEKTNSIRSQSREPVSEAEEYPVK